MNTGNGGNIHQLIKFSTEKIFDYLIYQESPVMEANILRILTDQDLISSSYEELFKIHFSLYHTLYHLKKSAGEMGYYLHLDTMRIRLLKIPVNWRCSRYFPEKGSFCGIEASLGGYCGSHQMDSVYCSGKVFFDPLFEFYINPENISYCNDGLIKKLMNGMVIYSVRTGEIKNAINFFGLSNPNKKMIQKKYYELAKLYHPDRKNGDESMMKKLNVSYRVLAEVYVI